MNHELKTFKLTNGQFEYFMQNEPNLEMAKINTSIDITYVYDKSCQLGHEKNKAKFQKPKMSSRLACTERSRRERSGMERSIYKQSFDSNFYKTNPIKPNL